MASFSPAAAWELPDGVPARQDGLWESVRTGSPGRDIGGVEIRKEMCIDGRTDPLFHRLYVQSLEASVVNLGGACDAPDLSYADGTLSGEMSCTAAFPPDAKRMFRWSVRFEDAADVRIEEQSLTGGAVTDMDFTLTTVMRRIGDCKEGQRPGAILTTSHKYRGEETLKGMTESTVWQELEANAQLMQKMRELHGRIPG